jgi:hypothetical protein
MIEFFNLCQDELTNPLVGCWKPLSIAVNTDMSAAWKLLCKGGGSNNTRCPCTNCAIINDDMHTRHPVTCDRSCYEHHRDKEGWKCYHHEMLDDNKIKEIQEEMMRVSELLTCALDDLEKYTKIPKREHPKEAGPTSKTKLHSIHFMPTTAVQKQTHSVFITDELILRNLPMNGDLLAWKQRLREAAISSELTSCNLTHQINHAKPDENTLFLMMQTILCILHCSNHVNLKLLTLILQDGLVLTKQQKKIVRQHIGLVKWIDTYLEDV